MNINYIKGMLRNVKFSYMNTAVIGVISFAASIIYARVLGSELYGVYTYLIWLMGVLCSLFSMGIPGTLARFIPQYYFKDSKGQFKKLIKVLTKIQMLFTIAFGALTFYAIPYWKGNIIVEYGNGMRYLLVLTIIAVIPSMISGIYSAILQAIQRFDIMAKINMCIQLLSFLLITLSIILFKNIMVSLIIMIIFNSVQAFILHSTVNRHIQLDDIQIHETRIDNKRIFKYSSYMYLNVLWQQVVWARSEYFFLGIYSGTKDIAIYGIGFSLYTIVSGLFAPFMTVINNYFAELVVRGNNELLNKMIHIITKYFIILLSILLSYGILYSKKVIEFIYSSEYAEVGVVFLILLVGFCINQVLNVSGSLTFLYERQKFGVGLGIVIGSINIILDIVLIPSYGAAGAAVANTAAQILYSIIHYLYVRRHFNIKFPLKECVIIVLIYSAITIIGINAGQTCSIRVIIGIIMLVLSLYALHKMKILDFKEMTNQLKDIIS